MGWTRPLEVFLDLTVALWFLEMVCKSVKKKEQADRPVFSAEKFALKEITRPTMTETGSRLHQ